MDFDMATHHFPPLGSRQGGQGGNMGKLCVCVLSSLKLLEAVKDGTSRSWVSLARAGGLEHLIIWGPVVPCRAPHGRAGPILAWLFRCSRFIMPWRVRVFRSHRQILATERLECRAVWHRAQPQKQRLARQTRILATMSFPVSVITVNYMAWCVKIASHSWLIRVDLCNVQNDCRWNVVEWGRGWWTMIAFAT